MIKNINTTPQEPGIRTLIDRYLSGETSNEEEATLRSWFRRAGDDVPEEWLPIRAMMSFVDEERSPKNALLQALRKPRLWIPTAVAAAAVAVALLMPMANSSLNAEPQNYAVIDGKVYTNPQVIKEQVDENLKMVSTEDEDPFSALNMMQ